MKSMKMAVFWDVAPCGQVKSDLRFRGVTAFIFSAMKVPPEKEAEDVVVSREM
jgi:hypothetical protein